MLIRYRRNLSKLRFALIVFISLLASNIFTEFLTVPVIANNAFAVEIDKKLPLNQPNDFVRSAQKYEGANQLTNLSTLIDKPSVTPELEKMITNSIQQALPNAVGQYIQKTNPTFLSSNEDTQISHTKEMLNHLDLILKIFPLVTFLIAIIGIVLTGYGLFSAIITRGEAKEIKTAAENDIRLIKAEAQQVISKADSHIDHARRETDEILVRYKERLDDSITKSLEKRIDEKIGDISHGYHQSLEKWFMEFTADQVSFQNYLLQIRAHFWTINLTKSSSKQLATSEAYPELIQHQLKYEKILNQLLSSDEKELCDALGFFEHELRDEEWLPHAWSGLLCLLYQRKRLTDAGNLDLARTILSKHFSGQTFYGC